uniref:Uncharacterized protein n=1 Tax=Globisporangium ultimum (strain ATCC 200006 / CBS 805.95 / DAOM BR144) TaxID=431595 RepID=K3XCL3_GLOUD
MDPQSMTPVVRRASNGPLRAARDKVKRANGVEQKWLLQPRDAVEHVRLPFEKNAAERVSFSQQKSMVERENLPRCDDGFELLSIVESSGDDVYTRRKPRAIREC